MINDLPEGQTQYDHEAGKNKVSAHYDADGYLRKIEIDGERFQEFERPHPDAICMETCVVTTEDGKEHVFPFFRKPRAVVMDDDAYAWSYGLSQLEIAYRAVGEDLENPDRCINLTKLHDWLGGEMFNPSLLVYDCKEDDSNTIHMTNAGLEAFAKAVRAAHEAERVVDMEPVADVLDVDYNDGEAIVGFRDASKARLKLGEILYSAEQLASVQRERDELLAAIKKLLFTSPKPELLDALQELLVLIAKMEKPE